ncbi:MAG: FAD binding domain-containing protein [Solirubrobacteraceae bacterium]
MRLTPFELHRPATVEHATALLDELGSAAVPYCGGTELLLVAKLGLTDFAHLVDVKGIDELRGISANGELRIGAVSTHRELEHSAVVGDGWPSLAAMERHVGNLRVRNVGTIGGNLCFADPHSDPATYLIAAGASVTVRRGGGEPRRLPVQELTRGPYVTALQPGELLVDVRVPALAAGEAIVHQKLAFRERPAITVAVRIAIADGAVSEARIAVGSVGVAAQRLTAAEAVLGAADASAPSDEQLAACAEEAAAQAEPVADANGSVRYKRQLVRVLVGRCAREAIAAAAAA